MSLKSKQKTHAEQRMPFILLRRNGSWMPCTRDGLRYEHGTPNLKEHLSGWLSPDALQGLTGQDDLRPFLGILLSNDEGHQHVYLMDEAQEDLEQVASALSERTDATVTAADLHLVSATAAATALGFTADVLDTTLRFDADLIDMFLPTHRPDIIGEILPGLPDAYVANVRKQYPIVGTGL